MITLSFAEAEYVALSTCAKTLTWFRKLYWEICHQTPWVEGKFFDATQLAIDRKATQLFALNPQISCRNKHISLKFHHVHEIVKESIILL